MTIYYKETLSCHQHLPAIDPDLAYLSNERQWLLVSSGRRKVAILHCYLACVSTNPWNEFLKWNRDLFTLMAEEVRHLRRLGFVCLCMGTFSSLKFWQYLTC